MQLLLDVVEILVLIEYVSQLPAGDFLLPNQVQYVINILGVSQVLNGYSPSLGPVLQCEVLLALILAIDHAHDALLVQHGSHTHGRQTAFIDVLEVTHSLDAAIFPELGRVLVHVDAPEPLVDAHVLHLVLSVHQRLGVVNRAVDVPLVLEEVPLQLGHVQLELRQLVGEQLRFLVAFLWEELLEEAFHLVL